MDENQDSVGYFKIGEDPEDDKAIFKFEGKILTNVPLCTEHQDHAEAINELYRLFNEGGGGSDGYLRRISDNNSNLLVIGIETIVDEELVVYNNNYSYIKTTFTETSTFYKTTHQSEITTTITKTFTKSLITEIYDSSGSQIFRAECDSKGNVLNYYDADNNVIEVST